MTTPDSTKNGGPVIEYLLKEVSFSTCDNNFFGELEQAMLIPNNVNIYGRVTGADTFKGYRARIEFPEGTHVAYLKTPLSKTVENDRTVLTYRLDDIVNYEDYWWFPLQGETEFGLRLNLLPPFPQLNPVNLKIVCKPDVAVGVNAEVTTTVGIEAREHIDNLFLSLSTHPLPSPGISMALTEYSGDDKKEHRIAVTAPEKGYPFPRLSLKPGESREYTVKTRISADLDAMTQLKCQQDLLRTRLIAMSDSTPSAAPCSVSVIDDKDNELPVKKTVRSTILQAMAQIMYSPASIRREETVQPKKLVEVPAV